MDYEPDETIMREDELYRKSFSSGVANESLPPPPGLVGPLIELDPPPLPSMPPTGPYQPSSTTATLPPNIGNIGFNVGINQSTSEEKKSAIFNQDTIHSTTAPGTQSVPPSYESVVGPEKGARSSSLSPLSQISDFDETLLPSVPNLPEIPNDDGDDEINSKKSVGKNNDDFDFDDLRRRFDELKNKKY